MDFTKRIVDTLYNHRDEEGRWFCFDCRGTVMCALQDAGRVAFVRRE